MHRIIKLAVVGLMLVSPVFIFGGCQTTAGRTAGEVVDDSAITTKVKTKLLADENLSGFAISVTTFEGEVTLTGAVDSEQQKSYTTKVVQSVHGVRNVNNLLKIK